MATKETLLQRFGPEHIEIEVGDIIRLATTEPLKLDCGSEIANFPIAYQTYGTLNANKSNAILICHGLTADQYVASEHPVTNKPGWWDAMVGEGKAIDTNRFYVICSNVLGGCMGSYGPRSLKDNGQPYGLEFPIVTIADMVKAQALLLDYLEIKRLHSVIGGSMGGMQVLAWANLFPEKLDRVVVIAASGSLSPQNIAFNEIGRRAITVDNDWNGGHYHQKETFPAKGLAVARMAAHVTYLSESGLQKKFGRDLQELAAVNYGFDAEFQIESYLRYQGQAFVKRFDPHSYCYITRAMDYFDVTEFQKMPFQGCEDKQFLLLSFSSDWLFPTESMRVIVRQLNAVNARVGFAEIVSDKGHDGFLLPNKLYENTLRGFLEGDE